MFVSEWTDSEVSSALALKIRTGALSIETRAEALAMWHSWYTQIFSVTAVAPAHFAFAAAFADRHELSLRAGDALHLAIAAASGFRLVTLDKTMAAAAPLLGIPIEAI